MTLEEIKNAWRTIATGHTVINQFEYGENFDIDKYPNQENYYPLCFLEIPYGVNYNTEPNGNKEISFALVILLRTDFDSTHDNHSKISIAESIADVILQKFRTTYKNQIKITSANGLSLSQYTDDRCAGFRVEVSGVVNRECVNPLDFTA